MFNELIVLLNHFDIEFSLFIQKVLSTKFLDYFFLTMTDLHLQRGFQIFIIAPLIFYWIWKDRKKGVSRLFGLITTLAIVDFFCGQVIKKCFARPRPFVEVSEIIQKSPASGFSFVSNHSANIVCLAFFMSNFFPQWRKFWWALAILVGFSRIYNGVHYLTDVMVGALIGWIISKISLTIWIRNLGTELL